VLPSPQPQPQPAPAAAQPQPVAAKRRPRVLDPVPPRWIRFLLWIVAVPLGFIIVFASARALGFLNSNQLEDVALDEGLDRFWPVLRLLPFVALVTAGLVQGAVFGITQLNARRHRSKVSAPKI
jgi:hypothetical protein